MDEMLADIEVRLSVLEVLLAFHFASQHMQSADPAAAIHRLKSLLLDRLDEHAGMESASRRAAVVAAMDAAVKRIADMQERLPRRLVD